MTNNEPHINTARMIALIESFPADAINDATIESFCTLMIPLCDSPNFDSNDADALLNAIDALDALRATTPTDTSNYSLLYSEMRDTLRDNCDFKIIS